MLAKMGQLCENQVQLHWHQTHTQKKDCSHLTHHAQPLQQTSTPPWLIVLLKCGSFCGLLCWMPIIVSPGHLEILSPTLSNLITSTVSHSCISLFISSLFFWSISLPPLFQPHCGKMAEQLMWSKLGGPRPSGRAMPWLLQVQKGLPHHQRRRVLIPRVSPQSHHS